MSSAADRLDRMTVPGTLIKNEADGAVRCVACAHRCLVKPGRRGICQVRFNENGILKVPWGYVAALNPDPIEKKPFFHLLPGSRALTFGMLGCDLHCSYCQNWITSQTLRNKECDDSVMYAREVTPRQVVDYAKRTHCDVIASSYNEPLITSEWAVSVFQEAQKAGLKCAFVSNGNATPEALEYLRPYLVGYKIDLKTMQDKHYRQLGGVLQNILDTIKHAHELGLWVEVVTLVVPGFNDSPEELWEASRYIASVSPDIPWHVTGFHPDYKMTGPEATSADQLRQAAEIGQEAGLRYVYAGNLPGRTADLESTFCPQCRTRLIHRVGFAVLDYQITAEGTCPQCGTQIPGIWTEKPESVETGGWMRYIR